MANGTATTSSAQFSDDNKGISGLFLGLLLVGLCLTSLYSYPVFHTLAETFSVIIACGVFALAWNTRPYHDGNYLLLLGIISLCSGVIDMLHLMSYKGVALFPGYGSNLPTSLWIVARYLQSAALFLATLSLSRRAGSGTAPPCTLPAFFCCTVSTLLVWSVFAGHFPVCYLEGTGLTPFKKDSELVIFGLFLGSGILLWRRRARFNADVVRLLLGSFAVAGCAEIAFIFFIDLFGISNLLGHLFKIISYYLLYRAIIRKGLRQPMDLLFQQLRANNANLEREIAWHGQAEKDLQHANNLLNAIIKAAPTAIFGLDLEGRVQTVWNPAAERILGWSAEEVMGRLLPSVPREQEEGFRKFRHWVRSGKPLNGREVCRQRRDGTSIDCSIYAAPLHNPDGRIAGNVVVLVDITERKRIEKELHAKNGELERFTYTVSHDLKSPLITIKSFSGSVKNDLASGRHDRLAKDLDRISTAADKMLALLDDLLRLSHAGQAIDTPEPADMGGLVQDVLVNLAGTLTRDNVEVAVQPGLPAVTCDRQRMMEVVQNLVENAVKYRGDQTEPHILIGLREESGSRVFFVRDNGPGIDPRYHESIFGLFNRLDTKLPGTGIGLALAKRIVELHGGSLWVESDGQGNGSTFCFTMNPRT